MAAISHRSEAFRLLARWVFLTTLAILPFLIFKGVGDSLEAGSQLTLNVLTSFQYDETGRDQITVLEFRESDLEKIGPPRKDGSGERLPIPVPVPYSIHVEVLETLAGRQPEAVFIDYVFKDDRAGDEVEPLIEVLCDLHSKGTRVFLATFNPWATHYGVRKEIYQASKQFARTNGNASTGGCYDLVSSQFEPADNGNVEAYALCQHADDQPWVASVALALYGDTPTGKVLLEQCKAQAPSQTDSVVAPMEVMWATRMAQDRRADNTCPPPRFWTKVWALFASGSSAAKQTCPYSNNLTVYSLFHETGEDIGALLKGKKVLYGASFSGSSDIINTPAQKNISGVYLNAMALDNLLVWGDNYKRTSGRDASFTDFLFIGLTVGFYLWIRQKPTPEFNGAHTRLFSRLLYKVYAEIIDKAWLIFLLGSAVVGFVWLGLGLRNFWGMAIFIGLSQGIDTALREFSCSPRQTALSGFLARLKTEPLALLREDKWGAALLGLAGLAVCFWIARDFGYRYGDAALLALVALIGIIVLVGLIAILTLWIYIPAPSNEHQSGNTCTANTSSPNPCSPQKEPS